METPLPPRRITRSQALKSKTEDEESNDGALKSKQKSALIDITNGSPIVGVAIGGLKTPSSRCSKKRTLNSNTMTPGSGESLLRGQVKILLQKVEEEEGVISKICFEPQVFKFLTSDNKGFNFSQMLNEVISAPNEEDKNVVTRSLFLDFSEKTNDSGSSDCSSLMTCQDSNASLWSVEVNASTSDCEDVMVNELCEGMSKISFNSGVKFTGKHTRFVYNSDGELEGELSSSSSSKTE